MSRTHLIGAAVAAVILFLGAYGVSPLLAANALKSAAQAGDADKLQRLVDFPAVRESLKGQLNALVMQSIQSDPDLKDNPFAGFAVVMAPALVNQAIESYVTADGLSTMMAANRPAAVAPGATPPAAPKPSAPTTSAARFEHRYKDLDTYVITSVSPDDPNTQFSFVLHRRGLFGWRLTRIELPKALLSGPAGVTPEAAAPTPAAPAGEPTALLARWADENEACRGGSGDDPATDKACVARNATDAELKQAGWCYGENAAYGYQSEWRPCGSPRFASQAEAEAAAQADQAAHQK